MRSFLIDTKYYIDIGISLLLAVNFAGLYISWLLLLKQMHIQSQYADKICSLFKQKDCNNVLDSKAAKLFGIVGWSEIGFGYFLTNLLSSQSQTMVCALLDCLGFIMDCLHP